MKGWIMIHKVKALYDNGNGLSVRKIAQELGMSRNTVSKYLKMDESEILKRQSEKDRDKKLDEYRSYIIHLLQSYPGLSAVKILRKLRGKIELLDISDRSVRRYIESLKGEISVKQARYYEPVIDMVAGLQCQVDGGEMRGVMVEGKETTVYFTVFVLSYSRLMYVSVSSKPIDTQTLIYQHDAAFRYLGGVPQECVYDQSKLVVISETFRELELNQRFHQYATTAGFNIRACEGYDPESKGKVEAGVKYVQQNGLYGEEFKGWQELESYMIEWLDTFANQRLHGTTGKQPRVHYELEERERMRPYLRPSILSNMIDSHETRQVDKTGLISWESNKYSVPMAYQCSKVRVSTNTGQLCIHDIGSGERIAEHPISLEKGQIIKNRHHYRDVNQRIEELQKQIEEILGDKAGVKLCNLLKQSSPKIYKDQLVAVKKIIQAHIRQYGSINSELLERILSMSRLTATGLRDRLDASQYRHELPVDNKEHGKTPSLDVLANYANLNVRSNGQGESHVIH